MTDLENFFNIAQENKHLKAIFEQMGYDKDYFDEDHFRDIVLTAKDICDHGIAGGYTGFIYYVENDEFYRRNEDIVLEWLEDNFTVDEFLTLIKNKLDVRDIVERSAYANNFYVWLYVETVLNAFYDDIEDAINGRE